jgi:hypothetical protein
MKMKNVITFLEIIEIGRVLLENDGNGLTKK